jgi:hypothetical protein
MAGSEIVAGYWHRSFRIIVTSCDYVFKRTGQFLKRYVRLIYDVTEAELLFLNYYTFPNLNTVIIPLT